jgi:predicted aspartyl protease
MHGKCNHTTAQCEIIKKQRDEYRAKRNVNKTERHNKEKSPVRQRYNTRSNAKKREENNAISNQSHDDVSVSSEINQIEEVFVLHDRKKNEILNTEVRVQGMKADNSNPAKLLLGLLDTGATGIFVKRNALENFDHKITKTNIQVKGRYAQSILKEIAHFAIKLPNFYNSRTVDIQAYVEDEAVGQHDIVLGIKFIQQLGLIFDFHCRIVSWDEISIPMRQKGSIPPEELFFIEDDTPNVLKKSNELS